jgi:hypothetical protein
MDPTTMTEPESTTRPSDCDARSRAERAIEKADQLGAYLRLAQTVAHMLSDDDLRGLGTKRRAKLANAITFRSREVDALEERIHVIDDRTGS